MIMKEDCVFGKIIYSAESEIDFIDYDIIYPLDHKKGIKRCICIFKFKGDGKGCAVSHVIYSKNEFIPKKFMVNCSGIPKSSNSQKLLNLCEFESENKKK